MSCKARRATQEIDDRLICVALRAWVPTRKVSGGLHHRQGDVALRAWVPTRKVSGGLHHRQGDAALRAWVPARKASGGLHHRQGDDALRAEDRTAPMDHFVTPVPRLQPRNELHRGFTSVLPFLSKDIFNTRIQFSKSLSPNQLRPMDRERVHNVSSNWWLSRSIWNLIGALHLVWPEYLELASRKSPPLPKRGFFAFPL
jgi:hypothetical protein